MQWQLPPYEIIPGGFFNSSLLNLLRLSANVGILAEVVGVEGYGIGLIGDFILNGIDNIHGFDIQSPDQIGNGFFIVIISRCKQIGDSLFGGFCIFRTGGDEISAVGKNIGVIEIVVIGIFGYSCQFIPFRDVMTLF